MNAIPFSLDAFGGLGKCHGLLKDEETYLSLEFQTQDAVAGILKSDVKYVRIPWNDLVSITLTKGWLRTNWLGVKIVIQTTNLEILKDVPGATQGRIELRIARKDIEEAEYLIDDVYGRDQAAE